MSSKFNSTGKRNKTPPVCQKHPLSESVPPEVLWPELRATMIVEQPDEDPATIWIGLIVLQRTGPPNNYEGTMTDSEGHNWLVLVTFDEGYTEMTSSFGEVINAVPVVEANTGPVPTRSALPPTTDTTRMFVTSGAAGATLRINP